jgi:diamine N-acetyltransferase
MIKNKQIILRAPEPNDIDFLYNLENDQLLWHVSQTYRPFSRFELEQYVFSVSKDPFESHQVRFIIELKTGETIGTADLFDIDPYNLRAGVGIVILKEHRNKGYAFEALSELIKYSFKTLNLHQLFCNIEKVNKESLDLFKKVGFEITCLKKEWNRKNDFWIDEYFLQLLKR